MYTKGGEIKMVKIRAEQEKVYKIKGAELNVALLYLRKGYKDVPYNFLKITINIIEKIIKEE
jgi:hypothetical protein